MKKMMKSKLPAILMSLTMAFTIMPMMGAPAYADDPHKDFTPKYLAEIETGNFQSMVTAQFDPPVSSYYDHETGKTVVSNPAELKEVNGVIEVSHPGQLVRLASSVNSGTDYTGKTIRLISDISLQTTSDTEINTTIFEDTSEPITHGDFGIALRNGGYCKWPSPIGTEEHPFKGTFDGQGHSVTDMGVFNDGENTLYSGLFGVTENAVIKNVNITGRFVLAKAAGKDKNSYAGALAGKCKDTVIENVHASCNIFNRAEKGFAYAGGLVGYMAGDSKAINSSSSGDIYNISDEGHSIAGGLLGSAADFDSSRKILAEKCFAGGNVYVSSGGMISAYVIAGGLAGSTGLCTINNCYATGNVSAYHTDSNGSCSLGPAAGGLVGNNNCDINNSYATGNVYSGTKTKGIASCCSGGLSGHIQNGTLANCHTTFAYGPESGRAIEVKTRETSQVRNFEYSNLGIQEHDKSDFSDGTAAGLLNGEGGNVWKIENGKTVLTDNPGFVTPQDTWGTKITGNGAVNYVDNDGKTSAGVKTGEIAWLKEESGGTSAWYGLDNSENIFPEGSRFWVKRISKEQDSSEWKEYYEKIDEEHKKQAATDKLWIFTCGVTSPNHVTYRNFGASVDLYVQLGQDWDKDDVKAIFISKSKDEKVESSFIELSGGTGKDSTYTRLKLNHFSPYAMISRHSLSKKERIGAACGKAGKEEYWECEGCGEKFSDPEGNNLIADPAVIPALEHKWDAGTVTKKATENETGVRTCTCTICKATKTETIPKLKPEPKSTAPEPEQPAPKTEAKPETKVSSAALARATVKDKSMTIRWSRITAAEGYDVFFARCNHGKKEIKCRKVKTIKGNKTLRWTKSGLKKGTAYKFYVRAYITKNGRKTYISKTPMLHAYTGNGTKSYTNARSVTVGRTSVMIRKGRTFRIKAKVNKVNRKKKLMPKGHEPTLRYMTTNRKVATASKSGRITARGKGSCRIYVFAHNGVSGSVKVTVP